MRRRQFTLIELLVTISVIIVLAGLTVASMNAMASRSDEAKTRSTMEAFSMALEKYKADRGFYPMLKMPSSESEQETTLQVNFDKKAWKNFVQGKYFADAEKGGILEDGFGKPFYYCCPGVNNPEKYDLWSKGPDGKHGDGGSKVKDAGAVNGDDITNWRQN